MPRAQEEQHGLVVEKGERENKTIDIWVKNKRDDDVR